jgi:hypothetical protein
MAAVAINATDHFGLGANFHPQTSSAETTFERRNIKDENGNFECETMVMEMTNYSTTYRYCNATPAIGTDLSTMLTAFGYVTTGATENMFVTGLTISFADGEYADVQITGVAYGDGTMPNATTGLVANVSAAVPAGAGFGVPALAGVTLGTNAANASLSISFANNHVVSTDGDGNFFVANNISFESSCSAEYTGVPTTIEPVTGWTTDSNSLADSNENHDTASWSGHRYFDKT